MPRFCANINDIVVSFVHTPKCGGTSVKTMMLDAEGLDWHNEISRDWGKPEKERDYKDSYRGQSTKFHKLHDENFYDKIHYRICMIRDPIERLKSAYTNRVLYHGKGSVPGGWEEFILRLGKYNNGDLTHHTLPMVRELGFETERFDKVFAINEMDKVAKFLSKISGRNVQPVKRQTGGFEYKDQIKLSENDINIIKYYYRKDYKYWWNKDVVPQAFI